MLSLRDKASQVLRFFGPIDSLDETKWYAEMLYHDTEWRRIFDAIGALDLFGVQVPVQYPRLVVDWLIRRQRCEVLFHEGFGWYAKIENVWVFITNNEAKDRNRLCLYPVCKTNAEIEFVKPMNEEFGAVAGVGIAHLSWSVDERHKFPICGWADVQSVTGSDSFLLVRPVYEYKIRDWNFLAYARKIDGI